MIWKKDRYYMIGWSEKHGRTAHFRIDRMGMPVIMDTPRIPAPEDLMKIASGWRKIVSMIQLPIVRTYLEQSQPSYDAKDGSGDLYIMTGSLSAREYLAKDESLSEIKETIAKVSGCLVNVHIVLQDGQGSDRLARLPLIDRVRAVVDMPVEEEE